MDLFENLYTKNYFFYPMYCVINIFIELNKEYIYYIKTIQTPIEDFDDKVSELDFIMIKNFNSLDEIKLNSKVFINNFSNKYNANIEYVIGLRKITLFSKITLLIEYFIGQYNLILEREKLFNEAIFNSAISKFTIYEYNIDKKSIKVHLTQSDKYKKIKNNILTSYILVSNILSYIGSNDKYCEITEDYYNYNYEELFDKWIEPIEPDDTTNYKKLLEQKINEENIKIDDLEYTDILCYRNFIQLDYQTGLRILYPVSDNINQNTLISMPILYTTYRINKQGQILSILH